MFNLLMIMSYFTHIIEEAVSLVTNTFIFCKCHMFSYISVIVISYNSWHWQDNVIANVWLFPEYIRETCFHRKCSHFLKPLDQAKISHIMRKTLFKWTRKSQCLPEENVKHAKRQETNLIGLGLNVLMSR